MSTITAILEPAADGTLHLPGPWSRGQYRVMASVEPLLEAGLVEHEIVRLCRDLGDEGLLAGERGTIVHVYADGAGYEVEFQAGQDCSKLVSIDSADVERARLP